MDSKIGFRQIRRAISSFAVGVAFLLSNHAVATDPDVTTLDALSASPGAMSAIKLARGNGAIFCTLGSNGKMFADNERTAVLHSPEFRTWHGRGNVTKYTEVHADMNGLVASMQNGRCNVAVETASNVINLAAELKRQDMIFFILPTPLSSAQLADLYARSLGFSSNAELLLAEHMRANNEELQSYFKLGITSNSAYDNAVSRMQSQGYSRDPRDLFAFLKDEAEGMRRNLSAAEIRDERNSSSASQAH